MTTTIHYPIAFGPTAWVIYSTGGLNILPAGADFGNTATPVDTFDDLADDAAAEHAAGGV